MGCAKSVEVKKSIASQRRISNTKIKQLDWYDKDDKNETTIASIENIDFFYEIIKPLGKGTYGCVYLAKQKREPQREVAVKVIGLNNIDKLPLQYIKREVQISKILDHPNIIKFIETYIDKKNIYIVMEYCSGGSLLEWTFKEGDVLDVMKKLFQAVNYMHSRNIIHRDLKLENILFESESQNSDIKIIDFGLAKKVEDDDRRHTMVGSVAYMAPEVMFNKTYNKSCDIWSLGIIMYRLICGQLPFKSQQQIHQAKLYFDHPIWKTISKEGKDLLRRMIVYNPKIRITIQDALKHKWFSLRNTTLKLTQVIKKSHNLKLLDRLSHYNYLNQFKKEVISIFIKNFLSKKKELHIRNIFRSLDEEQKGYMTQEDLQDIMEKVGIQTNEQSKSFCNNFLRQFTNNSKEEQQQLQHADILQYSDFLSACLGQDILQDKECLMEVFNYIDADQNGYINEDDIKTALQREGRQLFEIKFMDLISEIDFYFDQNRRLNFDRFCSCVGCTKSIVQLNKLTNSGQSNSDSSESIKSKIASSEKLDKNKVQNHQQEQVDQQLEKQVFKDKSELNE
ncbi:hypothetical protein ABPG74_015814 [Tetrahymena malaccensis]